jgi:hypothetical protein
LIGGRGQCGGLRVAVSSFPFAQPRHDLSMGGGAFGIVQKWRGR